MAQLRSHSHSQSQSAHRCRSHWAQLAGPSPQKKSLVETRDTLAAARRDTSSPLSTGHSPSPFPFFSHPLLLIQAVCSGGVVSESELRALQQPGLGF
eukprot:scaffold3262_cov109-Isochrysis_galbana.AAC.9